MLGNIGLFGATRAFRIYGNDCRHKIWKIADAFLFAENKLFLLLVESYFGNDETKTSRGSEVAKENYNFKLFIGLLLG